MMFVALLMRPSILKPRAMSVVPRVLADGIALSTRGAAHGDPFIEAFKATHRYTEAVGRRLAPDKSGAYSTCDQVERELRSVTWCATGGDTGGASHEGSWKPH